MRLLGTETDRRDNESCSPRRPDYMISIQDAGLSFDQREWVLRNVELEVSEGASVSILGPSGCGKSTLLRMAAGLLLPSSGQVFVGGESAEQYRRQQGGVAFVFQDPRLLPWRSVVDNIALPLELTGAPKSQRRAAAESAMRAVGLRKEDELKQPAMLSGGMRMRVSIARALVTEPSLILLDEPFAALDDLLREQLNELLIEIWTKRQPTMLFVTHNIAEAVYLSQQVVVIGGRPGRVATTIDVDRDFPRERQWKRSAQFAELVGATGDAMRSANP